jgi:phage terminase small subunit
VGNKNRKPVHLIKFDNSKSHLSKKDIELRERAEIKLGDNVIVEPDSVLDDEAAHEKWVCLSELYDGFKFVSSADTDIFAQYCMAWSEYLSLQKSRIDMMKDHEAQKMPSYESSKELYDSKIDGMINKKSELLQKLGGKIFLDPVSRVKSIPIPKDDKLADNPLGKFGIAK